MESSNTESNTVTALLCADDLNPHLVNAIMRDCQEAGEFSSYRTASYEMFIRPDLVNDDPCMVIALPGITSAQVPPSTNIPDVVTFRRNGEGSSYLRLREGLVLLNTYRLPASPASLRYRLLYLFDDGPALDIIPATEYGLQHDIWMHEMHAQSWIPDDISPFPARPADMFQLPAIIERNIDVNPLPTNALEG